MTLQVPDRWPVLSTDVAAAARQTALDALARVPLESYYDVDGNYAGATFTTTSDNVTGEITAGDLFAVTLLSVPVKASAARRLLDDGPHRDRVLPALAAVPADVALAAAGPADLQAAWDLHRAIKDALVDPAAATSDPWVTAAKLAARKRPRLLPVRDREVRRVLGLEGPKDGRLELQAIRALMVDPAVTEAIEQALGRARSRAASTGRQCVFDTEPLRLLDVALWWAATRS